MPKGLLNAYICGRLHVTVSKDVDDGTTPMYIHCKMCGNVHDELSMAVSKMYRMDQTLQHSVEWYKPTEQELADMADNYSPEAYASILDHVSKGGLLDREITETAAHISISVPEQVAGALYLVLNRYSKIEPSTNMQMALDINKLAHTLWDVTRSKSHDLATLAAVNTTAHGLMFLVNYEEVSRG